MALPASGNQITFNQINVELGNTGTDQISLNDAAVRALFGESSGAISMSDGFGASSFTPWYGTRGIFGGGKTNSNIYYITIASTGNSTSFGTVSSGNSELTGFSNGTRGIFAGGKSGSSFLNIISYITIASTGNSTDFGDLTVGRAELTGSANDIRGIISGGNNSASVYSVNVIDYITIASTGNATDFGNMTQGTVRVASVSNDSRVIIGGGHTTGISAYINSMDYVTIASTGNASDFGDLIRTISGMAGTESSTRGIFFGGKYSSPLPTVQYITTASTGNATDFGDISQASAEDPNWDPEEDAPDERYRPGIDRSAGASNGTRAVFGGGIFGSNITDEQMNYLTIASLGNTADFGDLASKQWHMGAFSGS